MSRKGNGKEADIECKAIETRGQGECVRVLRRDYPDSDHDTCLRVHVIVCICI